MRDPVISAETPGNNTPHPRNVVGGLSLDGIVYIIGDNLPDILRGTGSALTNGTYNIGVAFLFGIWFSNVMGVL